MRWEKPHTNTNCHEKNEKKKTKQSREEKNMYEIVKQIVTH